MNCKNMDSETPDYSYFRLREYDGILLICDNEQYDLLSHLCELKWLKLPLVNDKMCDRIDDC